jgi:8-hydroxy-5-deazaflavin:NADPH oxidoreductase
LTRKTSYLKCIGPDGDAREAIEQLITDVGLNPMRLGDVDHVGLVDSIGSLWFALALGQGKGRHLAFKVLLISV